MDASNNNPFTTTTHSYNIPSQVTRGVTDQAQLRTFLTRLLPWPIEDEQHYVNIHWLTWNEQKQRTFWNGRACRNLDEALRAISWAEKLPDTRDIYVCMSAQKLAEPKVSKNGNKYLAPIRNQQNVVSLKDLYLDIDVKGGDKGYSDVKSAAVALGEFTKAIDLPRPTMVVGSGRGLHAHWELDQALPPADWQRLANALAEAARQNGLKCDTQATVDSARVLRPPQTKNWKSDPPKPTRIVGSVVDGAYSVERIERALAPFVNAARPTSSSASANGVNVSALAGAKPSANFPAASNDIAAAINRRPIISLEAIVPECPFVMEAIRTGGKDFGQPLWNLTTLLATFTEGQREDAHRMAAGHATYSQESTDALYDRKEREKKGKDLGWPSCQSVLNAGCAVCAKCPHLKEGKSPIHLAWAKPHTAVFMDPHDEAVSAVFPLDTLAPLLKQYVEYQHKVMGVSLHGFAMMCLSALAAAFNQLTRCKMTQHTDWLVVVRLWALIIGAPSTGKSPAMKRAYGELEKIDAEASKHYSALYKAWKQAKATNGKNTSFTQIEPTPPARLILKDVTSEKAAEILSRDPRGSNIMRHEIAGFICALDRYSSGRGADQSFYLETFDGGSSNKDRVSGEIFIENNSLNIIGGVQPDKLTDFRELQDDGMLQRFTPIIMEELATSHDLPSGALVKQYEGVIRLIHQHNPATYCFDLQAQAICDGVKQDLKEWERVGVYGKGFSSWVGKLPTLYGTICVVLHVSDSAYAHLTKDNAKLANDTRVGAASFTTPTVIGVDVAIRAERILREYVIPNGIHFYGNLLGGAMDETTMALSSYVLTSDKTRFTPSDFTSAVRMMRDMNTWEVAKKVSVLVAWGWLTEMENKGRVTCAWCVTPGLRDHFIQRVTDERARKQEIQQAIRKLGQLRRAERK